MKFPAALFILTALLVGAFASGFTPPPPAPAEFDGRIIPSDAPTGYSLIIGSRTIPFLDVVGAQGRLPAFCIASAIVSYAAAGISVHPDAIIDHFERAFARAPLPNFQNARIVFHRPASTPSPDPVRSVSALYEALGGPEGGSYPTATPVPSPPSAERPCLEAGLVDGRWICTKRG